MGRLPLRNLCAFRKALRRQARPALYFLTRSTQAASFLRAASFLFCVGTNWERCDLQWSVVSAAVEVAPPVPEAQALRLIARIAAEESEINVFTEDSFENDEIEMEMSL